MVKSIESSKFVSSKQIISGRVAQPFKRQPHKMVEHIQIIRSLLLTTCLSMFDHFGGVGALRVKRKIHIQQNQNGDLEYWQNYDLDQRDSKSSGLNTFDITVISMG